ncbi:MAG TPA: hypothetical protein VGN82_24255 [Bosea sp. (in: a-proteobacteria)]|uniref:hypothetical protein n=1 Tax=Bosea sp. (in: a-proteobacteria) TaxID=1871050 RepID=UPI002E12FFB2|nr:hypothetical protein [Bosea sp. (in: a-proteobacteria)]
MKHIAVFAGAAWLATGFVGADTAPPVAPESPQHKARSHSVVATTQAKAPRVSEESARQIAWRAGVDHIEEIVLSGELWEVAGRDRAGNEKALDIHAHDGSVLD